MSLSGDINQTLAYAQFFGYSPSLEEIHHWLISPHLVPLKKLSKLVRAKSASSVNPFVQSKIEIARQMTQSAKNFPFIQMIAITGSVAINNAKVKDDIDLFIVTKNNTLWLIRPFFLLYLSFFYKRRKRGDPHNQVKDAFCPNLWLDESSLTIKNQNLYTAHEVLQVLPLLNKNHTYEKFISQNHWTKKYLANAYHAISNNMKPCHSVPRHGIQTLTNKFLILPNFLSYLLQRLYMYPYQTIEKTSPHSAFLHTTDYHQLISDYNNS